MFGHRMDFSKSLCSLVLTDPAVNGYSYSIHSLLKNFRGGANCAAKIH